MVPAIKAEWRAACDRRKEAERRLSELEGIERDLKTERAEIEAMAATWSDWSKALNAAAGAAPGSVPAETLQAARAALRKALMGPIMVTPVGAGWTFAGMARAEGFLIGGVTRQGMVDAENFTNSADFAAWVKSKTVRDGSP